MKPITLEDYKNIEEEFWPKYRYVALQLGDNAEPEQVLKVMESLGALVMKKRGEDKSGPFGFNKKEEE